MNKFEYISLFLTVQKQRIHSDIFLDDYIHIEMVNKNITDRVGNKFKITVSFHSKLDNTKRGKFRYVDQRLKINA